jgi:hypothetical protein
MSEGPPLDSQLDSLGVLSKYKGKKYVFVLVYYYFLKNLKAE